MTRFLGISDNGIATNLRCPRCNAAAKLLGAHIDLDGYPLMTVVCPSVGLPCSDRKLIDIPLAPDAARVQMDINLREVVRRFQGALSVIAKLKGADGDPIERLAAAIHVAQSAMAGVVPRDGRSIGPAYDSDAALDVALSIASQAPAPAETRTPGGIIIPAPDEAPTPVVGTPLRGELPMWRHYGYKTEEDYYRKEWGGADCPACGADLDETGRRHKDPTADEKCREIS